MKENKKENFRIKFKTKLLVALAVLLMFSTTVLAGNILQTATAPTVGITASVIQPLSGSLEISLKSAPTELDYSESDYVKFYITNNYPETVNIIPIGDIFSIDGVPISNSTIQGNIVTSNIFVYNLTESMYYSAFTFNTFSEFGASIPANTTVVLRIPITMPESVARGDSLNLNLVVNVEET